MKIRWIKGTVPTFMEVLLNEGYFNFDYISWLRADHQEENNETDMSDEQRIFCRQIAGYLHNNEGRPVLKKVIFEKIK